jgi:hypothetical protein
MRMARGWCQNRAFEVEAPIVRLFSKDLAWSNDLGVPNARLDASEKVSSRMQ